jgi:hypothetical protein
MTGFTVIPQNVTIERPDGSTVEIPNVTLVAWRSALRLQLVGLKTSRRSVSATVKEYLGLPKTMKVQQVMDVVVNLIEQYNKARGL